MTHTEHRPNRHGRHGRQHRSSLVRPPLRPMNSRIDRFNLIVSNTVGFLTDAWEELRPVCFEIRDMPSDSTMTEIPRWQVLREQKRILLFRVPLERLGLHRGNYDIHQRIVIEGAVFRAAAEYLHRDPWELGPERFRYF